MVFSRLFGDLVCQLVQNRIEPNGRVTLSELAILFMMGVMSRLDFHRSFLLCSYPHVDNISR